MYSLLSGALLSNFENLKRLFQRLNNPAVLRVFKISVNNCNLGYIYMVMVISKLNVQVNRSCLKNLVCI